MVAKSTFYVFTVVRGGVGILLWGLFTIPKVLKAEITGMELR